MTFVLLGVLLLLPIVTGLPRLYQQCTNRQKQSTTVKQQKMTIGVGLPIVTMSTQSSPNTQSRLLGCGGGLGLGVGQFDSFSCVGKYIALLISSFLYGAAPSTRIMTALNLRGSSSCS